MNKREFILKCEKELQEPNKGELVAFVYLFKKYLTDDAEIKDDKTVYGCYEYCRDYFRKKNIYFVSNEETMLKPMYEYLEVKITVKKEIDILGDFFS